jgi:hypothetical protein
MAAAASATSAVSAAAIYPQAAAAIHVYPRAAATAIYPLLILLMLLLWGKCVWLLLLWDKCMDAAAAAVAAAALG